MIRKLPHLALAGLVASVLTASLTAFSGPSRTGGTDPERITRASKPNLDPDGVSEMRIA
jgi:hypothetical protein